MYNSNLKIMEIIVKEKSEELVDFEIKDEQNFEVEVKDGLQRIGINVAYTKRTQPDFSSLYVTHSISEDYGKVTKSYMDLCLMDLKKKHVNELVNKISKFFPVQKTGEIKLESTIFTDKFKETWFLKTSVRMRAYESKIRLCDE